MTEFIEWVRSVYEKNPLITEIEIQDVIRRIMSGDVTCKEWDEIVYSMLALCIVKGV